MSGIRSLRIGKRLAVAFGVILLILAMAITWSARTHGFRPGRRNGNLPMAGH